MKKVSTAARKQSRNISRQKLTIGLDLGDRNSWYCVLDETGQIQLEQRVRTTVKALRESSLRCRAAGSRWKSGRIHPGSAVC
jgi:transposase